MNIQDTFYFAHLEIKDPINATYIMDMYILYILSWFYNKFKNPTFLPVMKNSWVLTVNFSIKIWIL